MGDAPNDLIIRLDVEADGVVFGGTADLGPPVAVAQLRRRMAREW